MSAVAPPSRTIPFYTAHDGKQTIPAVQDQLFTASFTIGAQGGDNIIVLIQLQDAMGNDMAQANCILAYLSDDAAGADVTGTGPSTETIIDTDGDIIAIITAKKVYLLTSESDGDIGLDVEESGSKTWYLVLVMPDGRLVVSDAITFV